MLLKDQRANLKPRMLRLVRDRVNREEGNPPTNQYKHLAGADEHLLASCDWALNSGTAEIGQRGRFQKLYVCV